MQKLSEKYWVAGMVLAKPVENENGLVLAAAGSALTDRMIDVLRKRSVSVIHVEGNPVDLPEQNVVSLEQRIAALDTAFARHADDSFMMRIRDIFEDVYREQESMMAAEGEAGDAVEEVSGSGGRDGD